jgi:hypothetical protein
MIHSVAFMNAIENTPGASIMPDGRIRLEVSRYQKPEQGGMVSIRTGVFYLPELKSPYQRYYKNQIMYGGSNYIKGTIIVKRPYIIQSSGGGIGPERAFKELYGKNKYNELDNDIIKTILSRDEDEDIIWILEKWGGDVDLYYDIIKYSNIGNRLRTALQEHIIAHKLRERGYDSVISYSKHKGEFHLSEVFDLRQREYPNESGFRIQEGYMITTYKSFELLYKKPKPPKMWG